MEKVRDKFLFGNIMYTLKEEGNFVLKFFSFLIGMSKSVCWFECKPDLATALKSM